MPKVSVNDIELYYESYGEGEPLIFIGGYCTDHTFWLNIVEAFSKDYRVIIFDNRGAGQSSIPNNSYTVEVMADDVIALCNHLNVSSACFVGSSMGGMIVQTLMKKYPDYVKRAVLNNSALKLGISFILQAQAQLSFLEARNDIRALILNILPWIFSPEFLSKEGMVEGLVKLFSENPYPMTPLGVKYQLQALIAFNSIAWVHELKKPCLVLGSDEDKIMSSIGYREMAKKIPGASYYEFKDVGHVPHIEKTEEFVKVVMDFLK